MSADVIALRVPESVTVSGAMAAHLRHMLQSAFPGHQVVILADGIEVYRMPSMEIMQRVESKLDALIQSLADEEDDDPPQLTLDGDHAGGARDQGQSLG